MPDLLAVPSPKTSDRVVDLADWVEINTFFKSDYSVSREDLATAVERAYGTGRRAKGNGRQQALDLAGDVFNELEDRVETFGKHDKNEISAYPFHLNEVQTTLLVKTKYRPSGNFGLVYRFLLFVSRGDMSSEKRVLAGIDPTKVFERLCADVLLNYWGGKSRHSGSLVFGTAKAKSKGSNSFEQSINELCLQLGEGIGMKPGAILPGAGDAKLDVAVWRKFGDDRPGRLVGFGQCKTGIHWKEHLTKLQPRNFCSRFMRGPLVVDPVRLYLVPYRIEKTRWSDHSREAGILFDRCRIAQYSGVIGKQILRDCKSWISAAVSRVGKRKTH